MIAAPLSAHSANCIYDEFSINSFDTTKWDARYFIPTVSNDQLVLAAISGARADVQSKRTCEYGILQASINSANWRSQDSKTDTSFGFEHFTGENGQCHYAVVLVANGTLGVLSAVPDPLTGNCVNDPSRQFYAKISNWDKVRKNALIHVEIKWSMDSVVLQVSDGMGNTGVAAYEGEAIPAIPLKVRLNADCKMQAATDPACSSDADEVFKIENVRVANIPILNLTLTGCKACNAGDLFSVIATVKNPTEQPILVEVKAGVIQPDGTEFTLWTESNEHFEYLVPEYFNTSVELFKIPALPVGLQKGIWSYEVALLSPSLGLTFAHVRQYFTVQ